MLNGSSDTVTEGNSSDAVRGTNDTITLGADDKLMADGGGGHVTGDAGNLIDLDSNVTTTMTESDENIVGNSVDTRVDISTLTATSGAEDPGALPRAYLGDGELPRVRSSQGLTVPSYLSAQQLIHTPANSPVEGHGAVLTGWARAAGSSALRSLAIKRERELVHAHPH